MKCKFLFLSSVMLMYLFVASCNTKKETPAEATTTEGEVQTYSDTASSFVRVFTEDGKVCIQKSNTYYELTDVYEFKSRIPLLLKIKKTELCYADSVNKHKMFEIEASSVLDNKTITWKTDFVATDLLFSDNTLLAVHEGVGSEEDFFKRFSLLNGKEIFSCSYGDLKVAIPNVRQKRFIGFTSQSAATQPIQNRKEENLLGTVLYSDGVKRVDAFKVFLKRSVVATKIPDYTPEMILESNNGNATVIQDGKSIILTQAREDNNPSDVKDFSVSFIFYYGDDNESTKIVIPVSNDRLDMSKAVYDKDIFAIEPL